MKRTLSLFAGLFFLLSFTLPAFADGGVTVKRSSTSIAFLRGEDDSSGVIVTTGTTTLRLYEVQDDATLKSYDFADNTFKATALTTETVNMVNRAGNNGTTATGLWTYNLATLTGFTKGKVYIAVSNNSLASPAVDRTVFQFGGVDGDPTTDSSGYILSHPSDAASATAQTNAGTAATQSTGANTKGSAIQAKTDLIATNAADSPNTVTAQGRIDVAISTRSSHSAADVWAVGTRSLTDKAGFSLATAPPTLSQIAAAILSNPANLLATDGMGKVGANNLPTDYALRATAPTWYLAPSNPTDYARNNVAPTWYAAGGDPFGISKTGGTYAAGTWGAYFAAQLANAVPNDYAQRGTAPTWYTAPSDAFAAAKGTYGAGTWGQFVGTQLANPVPADYQQRGIAVTLPGVASNFYAPITVGNDGSVTTALTISYTKVGSNYVLTWTADPGATSYKVLRSTNGSVYTVLTTTSLTTYTDSAVPTGTVRYGILSQH